MPFFPRRRTRVILRTALPLVLSAALTAACAKRVPLDSKLLEKAIGNLSSGKTVAEIEAVKESTRSVPVKAMSNPELAPANPSLVADPCPEVVKPKKDASEDDFVFALNDFGACLRTQLEPVSTAASAILYFKAFKMELGERPLSSLLDEEIKIYVDENFFDPTTILTDNSSKKARLRASFNDAELTELVELQKRRARALADAEKKIFAAMDARPEIVSHFAPSVNRYSLLQALHDTAGDTTGTVTAARVSEALAKARIQMPSGFANYPVSLLHPLAILTAVPDNGMELTSLSRTAENPFTAVLQTVADLGGTPELIEAGRKAYTEVRDRDNPPLPEHAPANAEAVHVALMDTGIDFVAHPDLALFLGSGKGGELLSSDLTDQDSNPWLPNTFASNFYHGTGTTATLLTILAHQTPDVLRDRRLDLAIWKISTARDLLQGSAVGYGKFDNHVPIHEAILGAIEGPGVKPKIVSISLGFPFQDLALKLSREGILLRAPWLWVMAAGNSGVELQAEKFKTCFDDVPAEQRVDGRILCVGALVPGIVNDRIASYSNFGARVDVYALESYTGLCPNGTSCATPAVSAAAAAIAARFPKLTPEQIKQVIVTASEERSLEIDFAGNQAGALMAKMLNETRRTVKVFDPASMIPRALEIAKTFEQK